MDIYMRSKKMSELGEIVEKIEGSIGDVKIFASRKVPVFQDRATWLAAVCEYYRDECGRNVSLGNPEAVRKGLSINNPVIVNSASINRHEPLYTVFKYTEENISMIVDKYKKWIMPNIVLGAGLLQAFAWSLYEVMDNVFQHGEAKCGYISMQYHFSSRKLNIAVTCIGKGIIRSMSEGVMVKDTKIDSEVFMNHFKKSEYGSIVKYAVDKGVTSKGGNNKGLGLYGLAEAVRQNGGTFIIDSGKGSYEYNSQNDEPSKTREFIYSPIEFVNGDNVKYLTCVNWSFNVSNPVSMSNILNVEYTSDETDEYYDEEVQGHVIHMGEHKADVATRSGGVKISNIIGNLVNDGAEYIILDFDSIDVVSPSFADEIIKAEMQYQRKIFFKNQNKDIDLVFEYMCNNQRNV